MGWISQKLYKDRYAPGPGETILFFILLFTGYYILNYFSLGK